jgi:hypothetical protein
MKRTFFAVSLMTASVLGTWAIQQPSDLWVFAFVPACLVGGLSFASLHVVE